MTHRHPSIEEVCAVGAGVVRVNILRKCCEACAELAVTVAQAANL
jgi:hypothetical protein